MEISARHPRKGDCVIRSVIDKHGRPKVLVDYPDLDLKHRLEYLDELLDPKTKAPISVEQCMEPPPTLNITRNQTTGLVERIELDWSVGSSASNAALQAPSWQRARQSLLALRLGQSTAETVLELSVGLSEVDEACRWALDRAGSGQLSFLLFVSPYGMGKSHALAHLRELARGRSMATGTVVLDGVGTTLCRPLGLISALSHSVEYPEAMASDGLPQRLAGLVRAGAVDRLRVAGAEMLHRSLANLNGEHVDDADKWEMIEDYLSLEVSAPQASRFLGVRLTPLNANQLANRPGRATGLLKEWAQACSMTNARDGLAVLLDEADVDYGNRWRSETEREQRAALLQAWRQMADAGPRGGSYAKLAVALAMTPGLDEDDPINELQNSLGPHLRAVTLRELSDREMRELGGKVAALYRTAYELGEAGAAGTENLIAEALAVQQRGAEQRNPRKFIRLLLEKLDTAHA